MNTGSITFSTALDNKQLEKDLSNLTKKIEKTEREIAEITIKRDEAREKTIFDADVLDTEKAKLQEIKDRLTDIRAMSRDKTYNLETRENFKAQIPGVQQELTDQKTRVNALQSEWNKLANSADRYDQRLKEANQTLDRQKEEAGWIIQTIADADARMREMSESAAVADQRIADMSRELEELKARQAELKEAGIDLGYEEYDQNAARIAEITKELKEYQKTLSDIKESSNGGTGDAKGVNRTTEAHKKLNSILGKSIGLYKDMNGAVSWLSNMAWSLQEAALSAGGAASQAFQMAGTAAEAFGVTLEAALAPILPILLVIALIIEALKKLAEIFQKVKETVQKAIEIIKGKIQEALSALAAVGSALKSIGGWFAGAAADAFSLIAKKLEPIIENLNVFSKMVDSIAKKLKSLAQMIRQVFVFAFISTGLRAIRTQMSAYLSVNEQFSTSLRQMQGVLLTAFQPIYDVVVPALTLLINVLSRAVAAVTQFVAVLFGTSASKLQANAKALYEQANATKAAGNAAEEAAGSISAFDEINTIQTETSAGGGAAATETGPLFDWEYEDVPFESWGEAFSAFLDKILGNIPKLKDAFQGFADWFNGLNQKLYDMFTFPGVLEKVKQIGSGLANALNYLTDVIDWNLLGHTLGAGLNLALNFLTSFIYAYDWMSLGRHLADSFNGLVAEIDWHEFGRLLWAGWKIGLETLAGFILGLNMPLMAEAASNIVIGFFTEVKNTIDRIQWSEIGAQIGRFLTGIRWADVFKSVETAIAAGIMATFNGLRGLLDEISPKVKEFAQSIVNTLKDFFSVDIDWMAIAAVISNGIKTALSFISGLLDPELFYTIGKAIGDFFVSIDWVGIIGGLTSVLANAIQSAVAAVTGFLDSIQPSLMEIADGIAEKINQFVRDVNWAELGQTISRGIEAALDFLIELMDQIDWDAIGNAIADFLMNVDWDTLIGKLGTLIGQVLDAKMKLIDLSGMVDVGKNVIAGLIKGLLDGVSELGLSGILKMIFVDWIIGGVLGFLGIHSPSTVFAEMGVNIIAGLLQGITETWNSIVEFFTTAWGEIKTFLGETWENLKTAASEKFGEIKDKIGETWDNVKEKSSEAWSGIKTFAVDTWSSLKESAAEKFFAIKEYIIQKWGEVTSNTEKSWSENQSKISAALENIRENITGKFSDLVSDALTWGKDICSNIASGISGAIGKVISAAKNVASSIKDYLGFSEPKKGPLSNFHTYMPDMLDLMSEGIRDNTYMAVSAASSLADAVANSLNRRTYSIGNVNLSSMPDLSNMRIPRLAQGAVIPPNREFLAVLGDQGNGNNIEAPEDLIRKIVREESGGGNTELLQAILEAIKAGHVIMVDRRVLGQTVTKEQNRMTRQSGRSVILG